MTVALAFPGQGSQSVGMQSELAAEFPLVRQTYDEASEVLGYDLWHLVQDGPKETLDETAVTQPAMLTAGVAAWRIWQDTGGAIPDQMAGHSLGEYTALVCAGALHFSDAVGLVRLRAELMQSAVHAGSGAMAAILGLDDDAVIEACNTAAEGDIVSAVNFNCPGQVVIAGDRSAVQRAAQIATDAGARRALLLHVSVPSHCDLMRPAADKLADTLAVMHIKKPAVGVLSNVDVERYETAAQIRDGLERQLYSPVRWVETVRRLAADGVTTIVECGPGKVLSGLVRRIDKSLTAARVDSPEALKEALQS